MTRAGALIVPSFIHIEPIAGSIDLYPQETMFKTTGRYMVEPVPRHLCVKRMEQSKYSSTHSRYAYWMGLNGQLHAPATVLNIIPVGQEARWVADPIRTGGGEIQNRCPFWESIPAT